MNDEVIYKRDLPLYIDVTCWGCERAVALSNTEQRAGRPYCPRCAGIAIGQSGIEAFLLDFEPVSIIEL